MFGLVEYFIIFDERLCAYDFDKLIVCSFCSVIIRSIHLIIDIDSNNKNCTVYINARKLMYYFKNTLTS